MPKRRSHSQFNNIYFIFTALMMLLFLAPPTMAAERERDMSSFAQIPIQHYGRIKPLETYARSLLKTINGTTTADQTSALDLLAEGLFNPGKAVTRPIFPVHHSDVRSLLGMKAPQKYIALEELLPQLQEHSATIIAVLARDEKTWNASERALIDLYNGAAEMQSVITALHFILPLRVPLPEDVRGQLNIPVSDTVSYLSLKKHEETITTYLRNLPEDQTPAALKAFVFQLSIIEQNNNPDNTFRIMPPEWPLNKSNEWQAPWASVNSGNGGPKSATYLQDWQEMARAYRAGDHQEWQAATDTARENILSFQSISISPRTLNLETIYQTLNPSRLALIFYMFAFVSAILKLTLRPTATNSIISLMAFICGLTCHAAAIIMRVIILSRPPVSTLYESVLFVGLICAALCLILYFIQKNKLFPLLLGSLSGAALHIIAGYLAKDGDTLQVLVAVLNTNFWLATHVIIITAGYGFCVITALLAHGYFLLRVFEKEAPALPTTTFKLALAALLFTAVGTILGGIWADQSWGRFWGWDPKENGALLIVLWLIWIIHGKIAGQLNNIGFMALTALLNVIVALAWFGVNLLSIGLHSYGFISGIAWGLGIFCTLEILFTLSCGALCTMKKA